MKIMLLTLICGVTCTVVMADLSPVQVEAKQSLETVARMDEYRGSIFAQAKLDGIDYRPILQGAIKLDEKALISLFAMNFMGEGGETHAANLRHLMMLWGDDQFSKFVASQPAKIRDLVVSLIDYTMADTEWDTYPKTLATSPTSITKRNEAEQDGTGQPATSSQSKSEGSDKPQPEAEGRSR